MIALIPARGGSKRISRKNIRDFCGKPLIYWTIKQAQDNGIFDEIYVSTEDKEIAQIAAGYQVKVIDQPMASDTSTNIDVVKWAVNELKPDSIMLLQCTSPLRSNYDIQIVKKTISVYESAYSVRPDSIDGILLQNGAIYAAKTSFIKQTGKLYDYNSFIHLMPPERSIDIDTEFNWQMAETIMRWQLKYESMRGLGEYIPGL